MFKIENKGCVAFSLTDFLVHQFKGEGVTEIGIVQEILHTEEPGIVGVLSAILYRPCNSVALSNCVTGSVNNSRQTKDTANGFNSSNVLVKSKIQNENYQINRLKHLKNTE